jgi:hypothetical protein
LIDDIDRCEKPSGKKPFDQVAQSEIVAGNKQQPTGDLIKPLVRRPVREVKAFHAAGISDLVRRAAGAWLKECRSFKHIDGIRNLWFNKQLLISV